MDFFAREASAFLVFCCDFRVVDGKVDNLFMIESFGENLNSFRVKLQWFCTSNFLINIGIFITSLLLNRVQEKTITEHQN